MPVLTGGSFKEIAPDDIKTRTTSLNQLIDVIQEDVSGSATRKAYEVFVTGGVGPGVTSSLYQTVFDQDFTLQTANPIFDITVGLRKEGSTVQNAIANTEQGSGRLLFFSQSVMMREKIENYRQYAATLLGNANSSFSAPFGDATATNIIDEAVFLSFKRLFSRDALKRETVALKVFRSASFSKPDHSVFGSSDPTANNLLHKNLNVTSEQGSAIFTDIGSTSNQRLTFGGNVGTLVAASNTDDKVGLVFYDHGTIVLDAKKAFSGSQHMSGAIHAMSTAYGGSGDGVTFDTVAAGTAIIGSSAGNRSAKMIPDLFVSASIDDIVDHLATTRFGSGSLTAMTFQNTTDINSTLIFCRASADEFNFSSNPTYKDSNDGRIRVIDAGSDRQRSFTFPTTIGLHDEQGRLLAVAKLSRPVEKNDEKDITFRVRLDF